MRVLVTGAGGMLGQDVVLALKRRGFAVLPFTHKELDIVDLQLVRQLVTSQKPEVIVNCAAYTNVDGAQSSQEQAMAVNGLGVRYLALACRENGAGLMHLSTDHVFNGEKQSPYEIYDQTAPLNLYGKSKLWGEKAAGELLNCLYIVRTSWLYGARGPNFVKTMLKLAREEKPLKVVDDQKGSPTYTRDLARVMADLLVTGAYGTYHATNSGTTSWYGFAREIFKRKGIKAGLSPCSTSEFPRPARRPVNSVLDPFPLRETIGYLLPPWEDALDRYLAEEEI